MQAPGKTLTLILAVAACLSLLAVGLHWWRTRSQPSAPSATTVPPAMRFRSDSASSLVFSPRADELWVAAVGDVAVYEPATGQKKRTWKTGVDVITQLTLSANGNTAMTVGYQYKTGVAIGVVKAWDVSSRTGDPVELSRVTKTGTHTIASALSPDGGHLALAWQPIGTSIHVYDVSSGTEMFVCTGHTFATRALAFSPDGKSLVGWESDKTVSAWDMESGKQTASWQLSPADKAWGYAVMRFNTNGEQLAYSGDGKSVALARTGSGFEIRNSATGALRVAVPIQAESARAIAFSPDGSQIAAAGNTYSPPTRIRRFFGLPGTLAGTAGIWDVATGKLLVLLQENGPGIQSLAFSSDGKRVAVGDQNGVISIWSADEVLR